MDYRIDPTPQNRQVCIFSQDEYDGDWPRENPRDFVAWFLAKIEVAPVEYRDSVRIELGVSGACAEISIYYTRPENAAEISARIAEYHESERRREAADRAKLAALRAQYGE